MISIADSFENIKCNCGWKGKKFHLIKIPYKKYKHTELGMFNRYKNNSPINFDSNASEYNYHCPRCSKILYQTETNLKQI